MHEALLLAGSVNTRDMLCHSVLRGRVKHTGRAQTLACFSEVCLNHIDFAFAWLEVAFLALLTGLGLSPWELSKHLHWRAAAVLFPSHTLLSMLLLWFFCWVIPEHKTL